MEKEFKVILALACIVLILLASTVSLLFKVRNLKDDIKD